MSESHVPGSEVSRPRVTGYRVPESRVSVSRVPGSGPDFRLHLFTEQLQTTASDFYTHYFIGVSAYVMISGNFIQISHYVRSVQIRSFFCSLFSCIRTEYGPEKPCIGTLSTQFPSFKDYPKKMSSKFY